MNPQAPMARHRGPPLGILALVFTLLFLGGLAFVISFSADAPHFPGPWEPAPVIANYFREHPAAVAACAFFQFGSSVTAGIFAATVASRLMFLGVRAAGVHIALFGGFATAFDIAAGSFGLWAMTYPGIADSVPVIRALYYLQFGFGGVGYSVPFGLLVAGICIPAAVRRLLPKWLVWSGLVIAACGELSALDMIYPRALFLIPLTRFPGFIWLVAAGFKLPVRRQASESLAGAA